MDFGPLLDLRVLVRSLRAHGATSDMVVLIPSDDRLAVPPVVCDILEDEQVRIMTVPPLQLAPCMQTDFTKSQWPFVLDKLAIWGLDYEQVALLDIDMMFSGMSSPERIFEECDADVCMAPDYTDEFNAGVIVVRPSVSREVSLLRAVQRLRTNCSHRYDRPEQQFLSEYVLDGANNVSIHALDRKWNTCGPVYSHGSTPAATKRHAELVHFCGPEKPRVQKLLHAETAPVAVPRGDENVSQVAVWQRYLVSIDPCVARRALRDCAAMRSCQWCTESVDYCLDSRIPCPRNLFSGTSLGLPGTYWGHG